MFDTVKNILSPDKALDSVEVHDAYFISVVFRGKILVEHNDYIVDTKIEEHHVITFKKDFITEDSVQDFKLEHKFGYDLPHKKLKLRKV